MNEQAVESVLGLLDALERQHRGEDVEADLHAVLGPLNEDQELAGLAMAQSARLLWLAVVNVARLQGLSYERTVAEFAKFVREGYGMPTEHDARLEHLEHLRADKEDVRPTWPTREGSKT